MTTNKIANVVVCGGIVVIVDAANPTVDVAVITHTMLVNAGQSAREAATAWCNRNGFTLETTVLL